MSINLIDYGFTGADFLAAQEIIKDKKPDHLQVVRYIPARVIESQRDRFKVVCELGEVTAEIKGSFHHSNEEYPVVGDFVVIRYNELGSSLVDAVLPRRSKFSRVDFLGHAESYAKNVREQVSAANFDYVFIMSSLNHDFNLNRFSRYLTATLQGGGFPVFILTKADLVDDPTAMINDVRKIARDIPVITISNKTGFGIDELTPFLEPAKTIVFLGSSGVGKSSLLNYLAGKSLMEVKEIREDDSKGKHTTTFRQLFRLSSGALVIDTPGIRELGLWDSSEGISLAFAEVEELFSNCRFNDCSHTNEPSCAVLAALEDGSLSNEKWQNYLSQSKENAFVTDHSEYLRKKNEIGMSIARFSRELKKTPKHVK
ncbi:MAG: ribosome small subunit-dependent GTPase A [Treponema sp.]|nr:ribosome small subunit-dependent GTPase A [Treponema sp.]